MGRCTLTRFFVSDHHIDHVNIITFCDRPFASVKEMNEKLLEFHNSVVRPSDHVTFLGDVTMRRGGRADQEWFIKEMKKYNGHKRLHLGNHDHFPISVYLMAGFEKIYSTWRDEHGILYSHIPVHPKSMGTHIANVHGHIHNLRPFEPVIQVDGEGRIRYKPYINVSVEAIDYLPISHEDLMQKILKERGEYEGGFLGVTPDGKGIAVPGQSPERALESAQETQRGVPADGPGGGLPSGGSQDTKINV